MAIVCTPDTCNGNPRLEGRRLTVFDVVSAVSRQGNEWLLHQQLDDTCVREAIEYCADRRCDSDGQHCGGCALRDEQDGIHTVEDYVNRFSEVRFLDSSDVLRGCGQGVQVMIGTPADLPGNWRGLEGWHMAQALRSLAESSGDNEPNSLLRPNPSRHARPAG
jgi:uncharacterized protein (DUF433 family)